MNFTNRNIKRTQRELSSTKKKVMTKACVYTFKGFLTLFVVAIVVMSCLLSGAIKGIIDTAPEITLNDVTPSQYKTVVYDCNGIELETLVASGANRVYVTIDEIPDNLENAFIAIEDERFHTHNGIDAKGIIRAAYIGISSGFHFTQGASTITQQLIKNSVFSVENEHGLLDRLKRKLQEQYLAVKLEEVADKDQILENYLNTINLGNNNLGVQSASLNYFNKDVSELTLSECAVIAAITQNPYAYNPIRFPEKNSKRRKKVLDEMLEQKYITQAEYIEAINDDVYSRILNNNTSNSGSSAYSYYTDALVQEIMSDLMTQNGYTYTQAYNLVYRGGLSIYSCEDSKMQEYAEKVINDPDIWKGYAEYSITCRFRVKDKDGILSSYTESTMLKYLQNKYGSKFQLLFDSIEDADKYINEYKEHILEETQGTIVVNSESVTYTLEPQISYVCIENDTGYVRVIVGGRGDKTESLVLNRATSSERQAGSTIKPLVAYGPALDTAGYTNGTILNDLPFYYDNGQLVKNDDKKYLGYVTIRQAIAQSRNIPALKTLQDIGISTGVNYLKNFGLTTLTENDYYLPIALGTCSVTNFEMTTAYSVFANDGLYIKPKLYTKVLDHDGNVILDNTSTDSTRVIKETTAWLMTDLLHSVVINGTIAGVDVGDAYVSAKSGTSQNNRDKWVMGYSSAYTTGIWAGYDNNQEYDTSRGFAYIDIWTTLMKEFSKDKDCQNPPEQPDNIISVEICKDSGLLYVEGMCDCDERGSRVTTEYFVKGTEPKDYCNLHTEVTYCLTSGQLATDACPTASKKTKIRLWQDFSSFDLDDFIYDENSNDVKLTIEYLDFIITEDMLKDSCHIHKGTTIVPEEDDDNKDNEDETSDEEEISEE